MHFLKVSVCALAIVAATGYGQNTSRPAPPFTEAQANSVDFGMMTWVEVKHAMEQGKTTALIYNGGTEQRGPQCVNGGHTLMGRETAIGIALRLGNAIVMPTLPYSVNNAQPELPGTIGLTGPLFAAMNEQIAEQTIKNGFKNIVLMGDHGGGQKELEEVAKKLDAKYSGQGIRVVFCGDVYEKATADFDKWLTEHNLPTGSHADIKDTSEMIYLGENKGWVRMNELPNAVGNPGRGGRGRGGRGVAAAGTTETANAAPRVNNGISGDARKSSPDIGKRIFDMKLDLAVNQIHQLLGAPAGH